MNVNAGRAGVQRPAPLYFVSPTQVDFLVPAGTALGPASITLSNGSSSFVSLMNVATVAPGKLYRCNHPTPGRLARLTHLIRDGIVAAFQTGNASELLTGWRSVFAHTLLPELAETGREAEFADMFAQTLAYGLFSARALSSLSARFTLAEAAKLIPRTNPFLRDFFDLITGPKLDDEPFAGFVQDVVTLLDCANMATILEDFGKGVGAGRRVRRV